MEGKPKGEAWKRFIHGLRIDAHAIWLAVRDRRTPMLLRLFGALVAAYALSPIDLIPDFVPILGYLDDVIILPLGIWIFVSLVPKPLWTELRARAEAETQRPVSAAGAVMIVATWIAITALVALMVASWQYY